MYEKYKTNKNGSDWKDANFILYLNASISYSEQSKILLTKTNQQTGSTGTFTFQFNDSTQSPNKRYNGQFTEGTETYLMPVDGYGIVFNEIWFQFDGYWPTYMNSIALTDITNNYYAGFTNGFNKGSDEGYADGLVDGKKEGQEQAEKIGYDEGYKVGYKNGFDAAPKPEYSFTNLLTSVVDVPVSVVLKMMDFEILGINLSALLLSLLSVALLIALIKKFS